MIMVHGKQTKISKNRSVIEVTGIFGKTDRE